MFEYLCYLHIFVNIRNTMVNRLVKVTLFFCLLSLMGSCSSKTTTAIDTPQPTASASEVTLRPNYQTVVVRTNSAEKQILIRLVREIEELATLIDEASFNANPDARIRFDYRQLQADLLLITQGIHAHVELSDFSPRTLKPIVGQYGR